MGATIFYRHQTRPDEAGMTRVPDDGYADALKDQLEKRGYRVVEIVPTPRTNNVAVSGADD
jgi:hypothetical protein